MRKFIPLIVLMNVAGAVFNLGVGFSTGSRVSFMWMGINIAVAIIFLKMLRSKY